MTSTKRTDGAPATRAEKVEEILAILGELYQRFGTPHAGSVAVAAAAPEYRAVGYRPYPVAGMPASGFAPAGPFQVFTSAM